MCVRALVHPCIRSGVRSLLITIHRPSVVASRIANQIKSNKIPVFRPLSTIISNHILRHTHTPICQIEIKLESLSAASDGVRVALGSSDGFLPPRTVLNEFGYSAGGWRVSQHPRLLGDVNGDGKVDIVGFSNAGVHVALGQCDGTFSASSFVLKYFGYVEGGWRVDQHPRMLGDVNGDGKDDIIGFSNSGVHIALGLCDGTFSPQSFVLREFGYVANGWRVDQHPRLVGDVNGDLKADIVGFANSGVQVALSDYH